MAAYLADSGRWCGANRWAEGRLFDILGAWVPSTDHPTAKLLFDRHSLHHAWRAQQWWDRLPVVGDVDRQALVAAPSTVAARVLDGLSPLASPVARLAGAYRVAIPRLVASYARQRRHLEGVSNSSMIRTLDMVASDLTADWQEGELLLQSLLCDEEAVTEAGAVVARLETLLASASNSWG